MSEPVDALRRAFGAFERFLFAPVDAAPLAALRIVFGIYLAAYYVEAFWFLELSFSPPALVPPSALPESLPGFLLAHVPYTAVARQALFGLAVISALGLALGLNTRLAAVLGWGLNRVLSLAPAGRNGGDGVVSVLCFLLLVAALLGHAQRVWALDARERESRPPEVPAVCLRLCQLQLVLVYFFSGFHKLASPDWYQGEALYYVFQQTQWLRFDTTWLTQPLVIGLLSYGVLLFELVLFPVLVWPRSTRRTVLALGLCLHVGIGIVMRIFVFTEIMPIFYLCFVEPRGLVARGRRLVSAVAAALRRPARA